MINATNNVNNPEYAEGIEARQADDAKVQSDALALADIMDQQTVHIGAAADDDSSDDSVITDEILADAASKLSIEDKALIRDFAADGDVSAASVDFNKDGSIDKLEITHAKAVIDAFKAGGAEEVAAAAETQATEEVDEYGYTDEQEEAIDAYFEDGTEWNETTEAYFASMGLTHDDLVRYYEATYDGSASSGSSAAATVAEAADAGVDLSGTDVNGDTGVSGTSGIAVDTTKDFNVDTSVMDAVNAGNVNINKGVTLKPNVEVSDGPGQDGGTTGGYDPGGYIGVDLPTIDTTDGRGIPGEESFTGTMESLNTVVTDAFVTEGFDSKMDLNTLDTDMLTAFNTGTLQNSLEINNFETENIQSMQNMQTMQNLNNFNF